MNIKKIIKDPKKLDEVFEQIVCDDGLDKKAADQLLPYIMDPPSLTSYFLTFRVPLPKDKEEIIRKDPHSAGCYADFILCRRWPEAESFIIKDPFSATNYAINVIHHRWLKAEKYIKRNSHYWKEYRDYFKF